LDIGCGAGGSIFYLTMKLGNIGNILGVDLSENMLKVRHMENSIQGG
jgi:ubiquinone/menaquinone biosynthesis C-methylase UbiE